MGHINRVHQEKWPKYNESLIEKGETEIAIQIIFLQVVL